MNKVVRALAGSFGIFITVGGFILLYAGISVILREMQYPGFPQKIIVQIVIGATMVVVGLASFGLSASALARPLYFLVPFIIIISFVLAGIFLPERIVGNNGYPLQHYL